MPSPRPQPDVVLHLAAQPFVRRSYEEPAETWAVNVDGTINVLDAARQAEVPVTVVVTSDKCYDNREQRRPFVESDPMGGHDPYSSSKGAAELAVDAWRRSYAIRVATARAGNVIGGGDWGEDRLIPDIMRAASAGTPIAIRRPDAVRPWQHVLEPLSGYLLLARAPLGRRRRRGGLELRPGRRRRAAGEPHRRARHRAVAGRADVGDRPRPAPARGRLPRARLHQGARAARLGAALGPRHGAGADRRVAPRRTATAAICARSRSRRSMRYAECVVHAELLASLRMANVQIRGVPDGRAPPAEGQRGAGRASR